MIYLPSPPCFLWTCDAAAHETVHALLETKNFLAKCFGGWRHLAMDATGSGTGHGDGEDHSEAAALEEHARKLGIDLALLRENLKLSPLERMRRHDRCVCQILAVRKRLGVDARLSESSSASTLRSEP